MSPITNSKGVLGTYSTPGPYKQQGGAGDLFYPGSLQTARVCWGPILPRVLTNSKGVLGTYSIPGPHGKQGGAGDLFYPGSFSSHNKLPVGPTLQCVRGRQMCSHDNGQIINS